jgi:hypothetical protein
MQCPRCQGVFARKALKQVRKGQQGVETQCPKCQQWLMFEPKMMMTKNVGLFILLVFSVANFFIDNSDYRLVCSLLGFAGAIIAFYGVFKGKLVPAEE